MTYTHPAPEAHSRSKSGTPPGACAERLSPWSLHRFFTVTDGCESSGCDPRRGVGKGWEGTAGGRSNRPAPAEWKSFSGGTVSYLWTSITYHYLRSPSDYFFRRVTSTPASRHFHLTGTSESYRSVGPPPPVPRYSGPDVGGVAAGARRREARGVRARDITGRGAEGRIRRDPRTRGPRGGRGRGPRGGAWLGIDSPGAGTAKAGRGRGSTGARETGGVSQGGRGAGPAGARPVGAECVSRRHADEGSVEGEVQPRLLVLS